MSAPTPVATSRGFAIRSASPADAPLLAELGAGTFRETFAPVLPQDDVEAHCRDSHSSAAYARYLAHPRARAWIAATLAGHPIGYLLLAPSDLPVADPDERDLEIKRIYVYRQWHGCGVAQALMHLALDATRGTGCRRSLLGVYAENARAIAFYRRLGFVRVGTRSFKVGQTLCADLVMSRSL